ncbi:MAG: type II toxin-antitoxin system HicB family antitoxin [Gammaproteobacteria bacterium]
MKWKFTLEYWRDDSSYVGKLKEVPGVFSQGATLNELEENIQDAYSSMLDENPPLTNPGTQVKDIVLDVA